MIINIEKFFKFMVFKDLYRKILFQKKVNILGKVPFSSSIDDRFAQLFENMCNQHGPPKYRILEAAIEAFDALRRDLQHRLRGKYQAERKPILEYLSTIAVPSPTHFGTDGALDVNSVISDAERAAKSGDKADQKAS